MKYDGDPGYSDRMLQELEQVTQARTTYYAVHYLTRQSQEHQERLAEAWNFAQHPTHSTPAFRTPGMVDMLVPIPASSQEAPRMRSSLRRYAAYVGPLSFKLMIYHNWTSGAPQSEIRRTRTRIENVIARHPQIPLAYFEGETDEPVHMGEVRGIAADAMVPFGNERSLMLSLDADVEDLSPAPTFFRNIYDAYYAAEAKQALPLRASPTIQHTRLPQLPHIDNIIQWHEDPEVMRLMNYTFEPGPAVRNDDFMRAEGYDPAMRISETHDLISRIADVRRFSSGIRLANTTLRLSPRRFVEKYAALSPRGEVWTEDNFLARDTYREVTTQGIAGRTRDLSEVAARDMLRAHGQDVFRIAQAFHESQGRGSPYDRRQLLQRLEAIRQRLGGPEDMFDL